MRRKPSGKQHEVPPNVHAHAISDTAGASREVTEAKLDAVPGEATEAIHLTAAAHLPYESQRRYGKQGNGSQRLYGSYDERKPSETQP